MLCYLYMLKRNPSCLGCNPGAGIEPQTPGSRGKNVNLLGMKLQNSMFKPVTVDKWLCN